MAIKNLSYHEAREQAGFPTGNIFSLLTVEEEYPTIYESFANVTKKKEPHDRQQLQKHLRPGTTKTTMKFNKSSKTKEQEQGQVSREYMDHKGRSTADKVSSLSGTRKGRRTTSQKKTATVSLFNST